MKKEETCSQFINSALVSVLVLITTVGFAFVPEALGAYRPGNKLSVVNMTASVDSQLDTAQSALAHGLWRGQLHKMSLLPCSDQFEGQDNLTSKLGIQYRNPCNSRISGYSYDDKTAFLIVASNELQGKICQASIQDQIEWNYEGNRRWARANLERICTNAEFSLQPGTCFHRIMHGGIDHGDGTRWKWQDALKLCAGTKNSTATISCFSDATSRQLSMARAIEQCRVKL